MEVIYLNNAATGFPRAPGVIDAMSAMLSAPPSFPGRSTEIQTDIIAECRERCARLLACADPRRIVLVPSATMALNLAILGVRLPDKARVITSVTEHNSVIRPLHHLAQRRSLQVDFIGLDAHMRLDTQGALEALKRPTALVALSHVSNVTGNINDVAPVFAAAKAQGAITLLDASQAAGCVPLDVSHLGADLVALTGHKGLHGPPGVGILYVAPGLDLEQWIVGGTGVRSESLSHPEDYPIRLESGTPNVPALSGLNAALKWHEAEGANLHAAARTTANLLRTGLAETPGVRLLGEGDTGVVSFCLAGWDVEDAGYVLRDSFRIACRTGLHCAPLIHAALGTAPQGTIRFSPSCFTSENDIEQAVLAIHTLATTQLNAL